MKRLLMGMMVTAGVVGTRGAMTEVVFDATSPQASYADGALSVTYDGSGNITYLALSAESGDGVTLTGDALSFAANATITQSDGTTLLISNDVTSVGLGTLSVTNVYNLTFAGLVTLAQGSTIEVKTENADEPWTETRMSDIHDSTTGNAQESAWLTLWENATLMTLTNVTARIAGSTIYGSAIKAGEKSYPCFFTNDGQNASCQFDYKTDTMLRGIVIQFRQQGDDVQVQTKYRTYYWVKVDVTGLPVPDVGTRDFTILTNRWAYPDKYNTAYNVSALYLTNIVFACSANPYAYKGCVTFSGTNLTQNCIMKVGGGNRLEEVMITNDHGMPQNGDIYVTKGSYFTLAAPNPNGKTPTTGIDRGSKFTLTEGALLRTRYIYQLSSSTSDISLDASTLWMREDRTDVADDADTALYKVTFKDGSVLKGQAPRLRNLAPLWKVTGTSPSRCETGVIVWSLNDQKRSTFTLDVEDVTGDDAVDFSIAKSLRVTDTSAGDGWRWVTFAKKGAGTVRLDGKLVMTNGLDGATQVNGGTLIVNGGLHKDDHFALNGGTLAFPINTTNVCQTLKVGANGGGITLGSGATIAFADSSTVAWEGTADVTLDCDLAAKQIRFGTSNRGLTAAQKERLVAADGRRLMLDKDGYPVRRPGMRVIFR